jgi:hypothetical protein
VRPYQLVQIVSEKISASMTPMAIVYTKKTTFGPLISDLLIFWTHNVQNDRNTVLIVISTVLEGLTYLDIPSFVFAP